MSAPRAHLALVGSGLSLLRALERLTGVPDVAIAAVADASGVSEATRRAERLGIPFLTNPLDVFRTKAQVVLELNGDERQYQRLLAVKPPQVEVMGVRGARLIIEFLTQADGRAAGASDGVARTLLVVARHQTRLYDYLRDGFRGLPGVEIVMDRRERERRERSREVPTERRQEGRRRWPSLDPDFRTRGFAIVRRG